MRTTATAMSPAPTTPFASGLFPATPAAPAPCLVCQLLTPEQLAAVGPDQTRSAAAERASQLAGRPVTEWRIRVHWSHLSFDAQVAGTTVATRPTVPAPLDVPLPSAPRGYERGVELGPDGGQLSTGTVSDKITDWSFVFDRFGLDGTEFEIVDDTVRMSSWPMARVDRETGEVVEHWLYAYKARFRRRAASLLPTADVAALRARVAAWGPVPAPVVVPGAGEPCTFVVNWADWQLGKAEGGGVRATIARVEASIAATVARFRELQASGRVIERIVVANLGDPIEGVANNYASQTFTVELNQRDQLNLALDLWLGGLRQLLPLAPKATFVSVLCNHGQWTRNGGSKAITDDADNAGAFLSDTVRRVLQGQPGFEHVEWVIARDEMVMTAELSGVVTAFTHGHQLKGDPEKWAELQAVRRRAELGDVAVWIMAHRHHFRAADDGTFWWFQCPALDGGSKWLTDSTGAWSTPGTLTLLVGGHDPRGWSDLAVL